MTLLSTRIGGRDGEKVHLPRGLAGSFETTQIDHVKSIWRSRAAPLALYVRVLMTKFSCFALAAADMKHVQQRASRVEVSYCLDHLYYTCG